jgi:hypothetical protein
MPRIVFKNSIEVGSRVPRLTLKLDFNGLGSRLSLVGRARVGRPCLQPYRLELHSCQERPIVTGGTQRIELVDAQFSALVVHCPTPSVSGRAVARHYDRLAVGLKIDCAGHHASRTEG